MSHSLDRTALLSQMVRVSQMILELSFDEDDFDDQLDQLQREQTQTREEINRLSRKQNSAVERDLLNQCLIIEQQIEKRFKLHKEQMQRQLNDLQLKNSVKNSYNQDYAQSEGYFIDKQR